MQFTKDSKWRHAGRFGSLLGVVLLAACAGRPVATPAESPVSVVAIETPRSLPSPALIQALAASRAALAQYPAADAQQADWQRRLQLLERDSEAGETAALLRRAQSLRDELRVGTQAYLRLHAGQYLSRARQYARLNASQRERLRAVEFSWYRGDYAPAYRASRDLVRELFSSVRWLPVGAGDSLNGLAARADVYDNALLWPLLWRANKGLVRRPEALTAGWRLRLPVHPQLDEIFAAARFARERSALSGAARRAADEAYLRSRWIPLPN